MNVSMILALTLLLAVGVIVILSLLLLRITGNMKHVDFSKFKDEEENEYEEEIMNIAQEGHEQGVILADEAEMISNIFEFGEKDVKDIMRFRQKIVGIEAKTGLKEAIEFMVKEHYTRYPVYEEDIDHIVGIIHFRDAVKHYMENVQQGVTDVMRDPFYVHEAMDIHELLTEMKTSKVHLAIVLDEFGQTAGIVSMEDILETIVGDILDEYDVEEKEIIKLPGSNCYIATGLIRLDDLEEILDISFGTEEFEILNGFLINELGHLPEEGEKVCVHFKGYVFTTSEQKDNVLRQIRIEKETINDEL